MKILFAGLKYDYGIEKRGESLESKAFIPAFRAVADEVFVFWFEENGFPSNNQNLQDSLIEYANKINPDVIFFVLMKNEITSDTLDQLNKKFITTNWFCDDHWRFDDFTKHLAPRLRVSITNDKYSLSNYKNIGCSKVILSQWATLDYEKDLNLKSLNHKYDISFVGAKNPTREWMIDELKKKNLTVECFGAGWDNGRVSFEEMKEIFYSSKINLNLSNSVPSQLNFLGFIFKKLVYSFTRIFESKLDNYIKLIVSYLRCFRFYFFATKTSEQVKARNFEIPGWGGFQLSQYALEIEDYYNIGEEIAVFTNVEELVKQCKFYLDNEEIRERICVNGHKRTKDHTYYNRVNSIFDILKKGV